MLGGQVSRLEQCSRGLAQQAGWASLLEETELEAAAALAERDITISSLQALILSSSVQQDFLACQNQQLQNTIDMKLKEEKLNEKKIKDLSTRFSTLEVCSNMYQRSKLLAKVVL